MIATVRSRRSVDASRVDLWVAPMGGLGEPPQALRAMLSRDEHARAERFVRPGDARAFVLRRAFLRSVLGGYLDTDPRSLSFVVTSGGKPRLRSSAGRSRRLGFNISHSDGIAVCAVGPEPVGVDVERMRPGIDWKPVARRFFSQREHDLIERRGSHAFFAAWTLKEAVIKASGRTLADLPEVDVMDALVGGRAERNGLSVRVITVRSGYAAAVAAPPSATSIRLRTWAPVTV